MRLDSGLSLRIGSWLARAVTVAGSTLLDGLVSYWPLNEVSGTRADAVGDNDLTDNNTVGVSLAGPSGTVAKFTDADNDYLSSASEATLEGSGDSWTIAFWGNLTTPDSNNGRVIARETGGLDYAILGSQVAINFYGVGTSVTTSPDLTGTGWHLWVFGFDKANNYIFATYDTKAFNTAATTGPYSAAGAKSFSISDGTYGRGDQLGRVGFWRKALSLSEIASLFNSGTAKKYADLTTAEKVGLVSYWNLDEVSGTRVDAHGANDLTDNNTVGSVNSGPAGTVASLARATSESLSVATSTDFDAVRTVSIWVNITTAGAGGTYPLIIGRDTDTPRGWELYDSEGSALSMRFRDENNDTTSSAFPAGVYSGWHHIVGTLGADNKARSYVDGALYDVAVSALPSAVLASSAGALRIGGWSLGYVDGEAARAGIWTRALDATEIAALFNSGVGKSYADLTASEKTGLVSYWDLSETSGTRADAHGANNLTDNNTVGSVVNAGGAMHNAAASFVAANSESLSYTTSTVISEAVDFSVSLWFKLAADHRTDIFALSTSGYIGPCWVSWGEEGFRVKAYVDNGPTYGTSYLLTDPTFTYNTDWHHLLITHDVSGLSVSLYIDGTLRDSDTYVTIVSGDNLLFGNATFGAMDGQIDEVAIWSRVLSEAERTELYNAGAGKFYNGSDFVE